jgi:hypothetical protein
LQAAWADARARAVARQRIERDLSEVATAVAAAQATLTGQRQAWPSPWTGIGLAETAGAAEAEAALAVWQLVALPKATRESEGHRIETIEADLEAFDADVFGIIDRVAPQLKSGAPPPMPPTTAPATPARIRANTISRATFIVYRDDRTEWSADYDSKGVCGFPDGRASDAWESCHSLF